MAGETLHLLKDPFEARAVDPQLCQVAVEVLLPIPVLAEEVAQRIAEIAPAEPAQKVPFRLYEEQGERLRKH